MRGRKAANARLGDSRAPRCRRDGVTRTALLNTKASVVNIVSLSVDIAIVALFFRKMQFSYDAQGQQERLGDLPTLVKDTMRVTLWVFIGVEGAVVVSDRARDLHQVSTATFVGVGSARRFTSCCRHCRSGSRSDRGGQASDPSSAYILEYLIDHRDAIIVVVTLLFPVLNCWLACTRLVAELPFAAANGTVFWRFLSREIRNHAAAQAP
jgi:arginine:ornithine antiporter/lysine permease